MARHTFPSSPHPLIPSPWGRMLRTERCAPRAMLPRRVCSARMTRGQAILVVPREVVGRRVYSASAIGFALAPLAVVWLVAPRKPSREKGEIYECGVLTTGETWVRFRLQYYIYAIMFVVFDIEAVFLYPWAAMFRSLGWLGFVEMLLFILILGVTLIYAWKKGALEWET